MVSPRTLLHPRRLIAERLTPKLAAVGSRRRRRARIRRGTLTWGIRISAPADETARRWGDTAFAEDLAVALRAAGQTVRVRFLGEAEDPDDAVDDVTLVLRGLHRIPPTATSLNYLWIISHPDAVDEAEISSGWERVYVASRRWDRAREFAAQPLLQAASAQRFAPGSAEPAMVEDVLFVGTSRGQVRPVIRDAIAAGVAVGIYGHDWERFVKPEYIRADHLEFSRVPDAYRSARIVLNDHWHDMRLQGFVSNRLFDAAFVGARVISDPIEGLDDLFGGLVQTYRSAEDLDRLLRDPDAWPSDDERRSIAARLHRTESFDARAASLLRDALGDLRSAG